MLISVIIPIYNSGKSAIKSINSVISQGDKFVFEIIIVDDGSVDSSTDFLKKNVDTSNTNVSFIFLYQPNAGAASARNLGISKAKGEYIAFLDSDDCWLPEKIEQQVNLFNSDPSCFMVGTLTNSSSFKLPNKFDKFLEVYEIKFSDQLYKNYFQTSTVMAKAEVFDKVGCFPAGERFAEEGDLFFRIIYTFKSVLINKILVDYAGGKRGFGVSGLSGNLLKMEHAELHNLYLCYERKNINFIKLFYLSSISLLKFSRRVLFTIIKSTGTKK